MFRPTPNDISFTFFGFPSAIQPFFWLMAVILSTYSLGGINNDMPIWFAKLFLGIAAILISILIHELGHALVFRYVFNTHCGIVLHGFGGVTIPLQHFPRRHGFSGMCANCFLSFAGPLAGFILGFLMFLLLLALPNDGRLAPLLLLHFLEWMKWIAVVWGFLNLLPVYPMDGGNIFREIFLFFFPRRGVEYSLMLSILFAMFLAVAALQYGMFIITVLFAYLAYQNYQEMTAGSFHR